MEPEAKDPNTSQSLTNEHGTDASQLEESRRDPLVMQIVVRRDLLNVSAYHDSWILGRRGSASFFRHGGSCTFPGFIFAEVRGPNSIPRLIIWTCSGHVFSTIAHFFQTCFCCLLSLTGRWLGLWPTHVTDCTRRGRCKY
jgi:hypothetical protein